MAAVRLFFTESPFTGTRPWVKGQPGHKKSCPGLPEQLLKNDIVFDLFGRVQIISLNKFVFYYYVQFVFCFVNNISRVFITERDFNHILT